MAEPFLAEIRLMSFSFAPRGWAQCNGQLLPINQNQALFALLGTTYGGNGQTNFALPDLRGRVPIHVGNNHTLGERAGAQAHTLTASEMPAHRHFLSGTGATASDELPEGNVWATNSSFNAYSTAPSNLAAMNQNAVSSIGGSQAHNNMQPFLTVNFCIALQGIFPSQN